MPYVFFLSFCVLMAACASAPRPRPIYVRAQPVAEPPPPPPVIVRVPASPALPGQLKPVPPPRATWTSKAPEQIVAEANRQASQGPARDGYFNAIVQYAFEPGSLYQVYTSPLRITDIALQPGEKVIGQPAAGDVVRWVLALGKSIAGGQEQWHVYLKPTRSDLETNLAINTDRRSYMLELRSYPDTYMAAVQWHYPQDEVARLSAEAAQSYAAEQNAAPVVSLDALNFNYRIIPGKGERPSWTPTQVFDDGRRTFIRFPPSMLVREAPALFVLRNDTTQLVNYRVRSDFYVVDRLIDAAELRMGQQDQEVVRIERGR